MAAIPPSAGVVKGSFAMKTALCLVTAAGTVIRGNSATVQDAGIHPLAVKVSYGNLVLLESHKWLEAYCNQNFCCCSVEKGKI